MGLLMKQTEQFHSPFFFYPPEWVISRLFFCSVSMCSDRTKRPSLSLTRNYFWVLCCSGLLCSFCDLFNVVLLLQVCWISVRKGQSTSNRSQDLKSRLKGHSLPFLPLCLQSLPIFSPLNSSVSPSASVSSSPAWSCRATGRWTSPGRKMEGRSPLAWAWPWTTSTSPAHCASPTWPPTTTATTPASPAMKPQLWNTRVSLLWEVRNQDATGWIYLYKAATICCIFNFKG